MFKFFPSDIFVLKKFKNRHRKIGDDLNGYQAMGISLMNLLSTKPEQPKRKRKSNLTNTLHFLSQWCFLDILLDFSKTSKEGNMHKHMGEGGGGGRNDFMRLICLSY